MTHKSRNSASTVQAFIEASDHPLKAEILSLRNLLLTIDPAIAEEIKWNAPSYLTSEHFATMHLRAKDSLQLILHLGAKPKGTVAADAIVDPDGLLTWLGPGRASVLFSGSGDVDRKAGALTAIVRQWVNHL